MKCFVPEISWHNRDPVYSIDFQPKQGENENFYRLASGGADCHVVIWHVSLIEDDLENKFANFECASDLQRHQKCVNVVRFSPSSQYLASGDDDGYIIIWKMREDIDPPELDGDEEADKESWLAYKILRGHLQDVYDIAWSPDSLFLVSGSIDNTALVWDVLKGKKLDILGDHKGFVQGVAWDPKNKHIVTLSSDRIMRVFDANKRKQISKCFKGTLPPAVQKENVTNSKEDLVENEKKTPDKGKDKEKLPKLFHGDTLKTFFRRLTFSPLGDILIAPCGIMENGEKSRDVSYVFTRGQYSKPALHLPSPGQYTVAARCSPLHYRLRKEGAGLLALPYRIVYALATRNSLILYDTEQELPFAYVYNIHYTGITDVSWSPDGRLLISSSSEGFCSVIAFEEREIGTIYSQASLNSENVDQESERASLETIPFCQQQNYKDNPALKSIQDDSDVFKTPTKVPREKVLKTPERKITRWPSDDTSDFDDLNSSQCSQISNVSTVSELSVCMVNDENELISKEEQARRLMSPRAQATSPVRQASTQSPKGSPANSKTGRRVQLITLKSPKSRKKL